MIEKMKKVVLISRGSEKKELLLSLREEGVMHVSDLVHKTPKLDEMEKDRSDYVRIRQVLVERADKKDKRKLSLSDSEFASVHQAILKDIEDEGKINERLVQLQAERDRIKPFGDFNPDDVKALSDDGIPIFIYAGGKKEIEKLRSDEYVSFIPLRYDGKLDAAAVLYEKLPESSGLTEISLPSESLSEIEAEILMERKRLDEIRKRISECGVYITAYDSYLRKADERITFERVSSTISGDDIIYLKGYIPEKDEKRFMKKAEKEGWAYIIDDISDEDNPPTLVRYKGITRIVKPIFDILGTVPGYREYDISSFFLVFFSLFFAFCLGDSGYGLALIALGFILKKKLSKDLAGMMNMVITLGIVTTVFGAVLGTFFGVNLFDADLPAWMKEYMIAGKIEGTTYDKAMVLSLLIGVVNICLAMTVKAICNTARYGFKETLSDWGWLLLVVGFICTGGLSFFQIISAQVTQWSFIIIGGVAAIGIYLLNNLHRNVFANIGAGLWDTYNMATGLAGDTLSYIRLYALGLAGGMLGGVFNQLAFMTYDAAGPFIGWLPCGLILVFGHALNIAMSCLSGFVHPLRLTFVEYFKNSGYEGKGDAYAPFATVDK